MSELFDEEYWSKKEKEENAKLFLKIAYKFKNSPSTRNLVLIVLLSFVAYMWMYVFVFIANDDFLKQYYTFPAFYFEFAYSYEQANIVLNTWGSIGIFRNFLLNIFEYPFIISYILILMGLSILAMRQLKDKFLNIGLRLIYLPVLAGILDAIQNIFVIIMLINGNAINFMFPLIVAILGIIKYILIIGTIGFVIFAIVVKIFYYFQIIKEGR